MSNLEDDPQALRLALAAAQQRIRQLESSGEPASRGVLAQVLVDWMYQFVALLDPAGTVLEINRAALEVVASARDQVLGRPFWQTPWWEGLPEAQSRLQQALRQAVATGQFQRYEAEHWGGGDSRESVTVDFSVSPVRDSTGAVCYLVVEGRNITDRIRAEAQLALRNQQLAALNAQLERLDERRTQLFTNISHELRTPLSLILGPVDILRTQAQLSAKDAQLLEVVSRNAKVLLEHVNNLLEVGKLEARQTALHQQPADLGGLLRVCAACFEHAAASRRIQLSVEAPKSALAQVDEARMRQVVQNLLANAFKFTPDGGHIRCTLELSSGRARLRVTDDGPGVPDGLKERIFEPFFQAEQGRHPLGGTGLGLSIARELVALHQGRLWVSDAEGGGACFTVEIPAQAPAGAALLPPPEAAPSLPPSLPEPPATLALRPEGPVTASPRSKVLVVEDNPEMAAFIARVLEADHQVLLADGGQAGLAVALAERPDLVVTDLMMQPVSGEELVRQLREEASLVGMPVLVLSAVMDEAKRVELLRSGAQDYLGKPFYADELKARAANLVSLKRTRDLLQRELESGIQDVEVLAAELVTRRRDLLAALGESQRARAQAERLSSDRLDFLSLVSHELRTPLTALHLNLQRMEREARATSAPQQQSLLGRALSASARLAGLIASLLEHVRMESGRVQPESVRLDLGALVEEVLEELRPQAEQKGLALSRSLEGGGPVWSDPRLLRIIVGNLVGNALKFTEKGTVFVRVERGPEAVRLCVTDTGPGIAPESQPAIFEPFLQLEPVRHKHTPGVGLGLALVRQMVGVLGGTLGLESFPGKGSAFTVSLPLRSPTAGPSLQPLADNLEAPGDGLDGGASHPHQ